MKITFELSDSDLERFRELMRRAGESSRGLSDSEIVDNARRLQSQVWQSDASDFIRARMHRLETITAMVEDAEWGMEEDDRSRVLQALSYFSEPDDLIPDDTPGLGFLDDAIMIDIVAEELEHEIQAYRDFCVFRSAEADRLGHDTGAASHSDWLDERRRQLHERMRRRRRRPKGDAQPGTSRFSLF